MTPEQKVAFIMAQTACASAEIAGMTAANLDRACQGEEMAYGGGEFFAVIKKYGISHNAVITFFQVE